MDKRSRQHQLETNLKGLLICQVCKQTWKGKPRSNCPGIPLILKPKVAEVELVRQEYWQIDSLVKLNLRPITPACCIKQGKEYIYFYDPEGETEIIDSSLPPVLPTHPDCDGRDSDRESCRRFNNYLKTEVGLRKLNLKPGTAEPVAACYDGWSEKFVFLYNPLDCEVYRLDLPVASRRLICQHPSKDLILTEDLHKLNLRVRSHAIAHAAFWNNYQKDWDLYWDIEQCEYIDPELPPVYPKYSLIPEEYCQAKELIQHNRAVDKEGLVGAIWNETEQNYQLFYDPQRCAILDPDLPPLLTFAEFLEECRHLKTIRNLKKLNLVPRDRRSVKAVYWANYEKGFEPLYELTDCDRLDRNLPPIIKERSSRGDLLDTNDLTKWNLKPRQGSRPIAVTWNYTEDDWENLWDIKQCQERSASLPPVVDRRSQDLFDESQLAQINRKLSQVTVATACIWNSYEDGFTLLYNPGDCDILDPDLPTCYSSSQIPDYLYKEAQLVRINRRLTCDTPPFACYFDSYQNIFDFLYQPEDCSLIDPNLPTCYDKERSLVPKHLNSQWAWQQKEPLYELKDNAVPSGCFKSWNSYKRKYEVVLLYERSSLSIHDRNILISKTKLKQNYKLSDSWIKKLGKPDELQPNPVNPRFGKMKMYYRDRIEAFLAENHEDYLKHLAKRNTYLAIFEKNKDKLLSPEARAKAIATKKVKKKIKPVTKQFNWDANHKLVREQSLLCLRCASGMALGSGYFCAVNPEGLAIEQLPCKDFHQRSL